jgi:hypothetical protein
MVSTGRDQGAGGNKQATTLTAQITNANSDEEFALPMAA